MNEKLEYYHKVLGLKPGATPGEVKAAYRRLIKLYHPDRDNSLNTLLMYQEINNAYKVLLNQPAVAETDVNFAFNSSYSKKTSQTSNDSSKRAQSNADSSKRTSQTSNYGFERAQHLNTNNRDNLKQKSVMAFEKFKKDYKSKIPFKLQNLPAIFLRSLSELLADSKNSLGKVCISLMFIVMYFRNSHLFQYRIPPGILFVLFYVISLVLFVFFRYYFKPSTWPISLRIVAAITYGATITLLVACFRQFPTVIFIRIWFTAALSVSFLMLPQKYSRKE